MSQMLRDHKVINRWTNGRKAVVYLLDRGDGSCFILKHYKARFMGTMFREWSSTSKKTVNGTLCASHIRAIRSVGSVMCCRTSPVPLPNTS